MRYAIIEDGEVKNIAVSDTALHENWIASEVADIGDIYENETFIKPKISIDLIRIELWERTKAERDHRTYTGGYLASGKWFHSDTFSRSQQLGLVLMGANIPSGLMWKTMDGSFIEMTQSLAQEIFQAAVTSDSNFFSYAESLRQQIENIEDPESISIFTGWPPIFGEATSGEASTVQR